jgi:hypothetical protein
MAKISKGKFRWLRAYYSTFVLPVFYIDRQGRPCIVSRGKVMVNVKLVGPQGEKAPSPVEPETFTLDFTGF